MPASAEYTRLIVELLGNQSLKDQFGEIVNILKKRIILLDYNNINISTNRYPANHFYVTYYNRLKYKNYMLAELGVSKTLDVLRKENGFLTVGYVQTTEEIFTIFFTGELDKIVALFRVTYKEKPKPNN